MQWKGAIRTAPNLIVTASKVNFLRVRFGVSLTHISTYIDTFNRALSPTKSQPLPPEGGRVVWCLKPLGVGIIALFIVIFDVFDNRFVCDIAAGCTEIAPAPEMPPPIAFAKLRKSLLHLAA